MKPQPYLVLASVWMVIQIHPQYPEYPEECQKTRCNPAKRRTLSLLNQTKISKYELTFWINIWIVTQVWCLLLIPVSNLKSQWKYIIFETWSKYQVWLLFPFIPHFSLSIFHLLYTPPLLARYFTNWNPTLYRIHAFLCVHN